MGTYLSIRRTGFKALLITAAVMVMLALSATCVYAADTASITEVSPASPEVNKEITVKAKGDFSLFKSDYVYFRVTANLAPEPFHEYEGVKRALATSIATYKFTPAQEGSYLIEVCRGPTDSSGNHVDLAEEDFVAEDSRTITVQKDISKAETSIAIENPVYTGSELTPKPVVTVDGKTLAENTDYEITSYANNTNAGEATITTTGKGFDKGTKSASFQIQPADIAEASADDIEDLEYTGDTLMPAPTFTWNDRTLDSTTDYDLSYDNNINVGTGQIIVTGKNNFTGTLPVSFDIKKASIRNATLSGLEDKTYTGGALTQDLTLKYQGKTLEQDKDYSLSYQNNTELGTATIIIEGMGNFKDSLIRTFSITEPSNTPSGWGAYILEPEADAQYQVGNKITVKAKANMFAATWYAGSQLNAPNYIYIKVTRNGQKVLYERFPYYDTSEIAETTFEADEAGEYVIETRRHNFEYVEVDNDEGGFSLKYQPIPYESFSPQDSISVLVGIDSPPVKTDLSTATISGLEDKEYTGNAITQSPVVTLDGKTLTEGTDYYVTFNAGGENVNVGPVIVTVHGKGSYEGVVNTHFNIVKKQLTEDMISLTPTSFSYSGELQKPDVVVRNGNVLLALDKDYTLTNEGGVTPGDYEVAIEGKGNYTGTATKKYTIDKWSIDKAAVTVDPASYAYDGTAKEPSVTAMLNGIALPLETDFDISYDKNTNAGTAKAIITAKADSYYTGSASGNFTIEKRSITEDGFTVGTIDDLTYNREAQTPVPEVKWGEQALKTPDDFTLSYENNTKAGLATATITGAGNFKGSRTVNFNIGRKDLSDESITVDPIPEQPYKKGSPVTPEVTVKDGSTVLTADEISVTYRDNEHPGTAYVTITGKGNYKGTIEDVAFAIGKASIKDAEVTADPATFTYDGTEKKPNVSVTLDGETLAQDLYTVSYENNVNAGPAKVTVTAKEDSYYTGTATGSFKIDPADINSDLVKVNAIDDLTYNRNAQTPVPEVLFDEKILTKDTDFELTYENNTNAGNATLKITGKGNFTGTRSADFTILQKDLADESISVDPIPYQKYVEGTPATPAVTVRDGEAVLTADDFTVSYEDNEAPGTAYATITGKGNYTGTIEDLTFEIKDRDDYAVSALADKVDEIEKILDQYLEDDQGALQAAIDEAKRLLSDEDSTTSQLEEALETLVTLQGIADDNLAGVQVPMDGAIVTADPSSYVYNGKARTPDVTVTLDGSVLPSDQYTVSYDNNINAGDAKITVTAIEDGHYTGTATGTFRIEPKNLADEDIKVAPIPVQQYEEGTPAEPAITVKDGSVALTEDDITITYKDNDKPGTASVTITGKGNYTGTIEGLTFEIKGRDDYVVSALADKVNEIEAVIGQYETGDQEALQAAIGEAKQLLADPASTTEQLEQALDTLNSLQAVADENLANKKIPIEGATVTADPQVYIYDGTAKEPKVTVTLGETVIPEGQYTVTYDKNTNAGEAAITITAKEDGPYTGRASGAFIIDPKNLADESVTVDPVPPQKYTEGTPASPKVTVRDGDKVLTADDITVNYKDNDKPGTGSITIEGKGNYTGKIENLTFDILSQEEYAPVALTDKIAEIEAIADQYTDSDRKALTAAIEEAKQLLADPAATTQQIEQALENLTTLLETAHELPSAAATEASILAQKTDKDPAGSSFAPLTLKSSKQSKKTNVLTWKKVPGATAYVIYGNKCGKTSRIKKLATVTKNTFTHKKLKKGTYYKYVVVAVKDTNAGLKTTAISKMIHVATSGGKYGNYKSVSVPKKALKKAKKLSKGYSMKLGAKAVKSSSRARNHVKLRYQSSNKSIATVSSKGVVKGKAEGTCYIYVYAQNGVYKRIPVKVVLSDLTRIPR